MKTLREIYSPQGPEIRFADGSEAICLCSNDYLGLAADPAVVAAAAEGLRAYGAGTASVRFICGLFTPHLELERDLAGFLGTERAISYVSCWNANQALLDTLCDKRTWILSDELNHASIIDGIRLARPAGKAGLRARRPGRARARARRGSRGAPLPGRHRRRLQHGGRPGAAAGDRRADRSARRDADRRRLPRPRRPRPDRPRHGRALRAQRRVDIVTGTLGKALGGAAGGFVAGSAELCELLEQRSRAAALLQRAAANRSPAAPARRSASSASDPGRVGRLHENVDRFRAGRRGRRAAAARGRERDRPDHRRRDPRRDRG